MKQKLVYSHIRRKITKGQGNEGEGMTRKSEELNERFREVFSVESGTLPGSTSASKSTGHNTDNRTGEENNE